MATGNDRILGVYSLPEQIERIRLGEGESGRRAESLIRTDQLRVVLVTMREGASLHEHSAPGHITIHVLEGEMTVTVEDDEIKLTPGGMIAIGATVRHAVHAMSDGAFLLTISSPVPGETSPVEDNH